MTADGKPAARILSEEQLGAMFAEKLADAALRFAHTVGAPAHIAVFALGTAFQVLGEHHLGRERIAALLREIADELLEESDDEDEPARPVLN